MVGGCVGCIEKREIPFAMSAAGWKPEAGKIQEVLDTVRPMESGDVDFSEYVRLMTPTIKNQDELEIFRVGFDMFDANGKGYITIDDLQRVANEIGENEMEMPEFEEMIKEAGSQGKVDYKSFVKIMQFTATSSF